MNNIVKQSTDYVNSLLIPLEKHYYHHFNHALKVSSRAVYLGKKEGLNDKQLEILALAGLFHDTGFIIQYDDNEFIGAKIARNFLKSMLYQEDRIKEIERVIMATVPSYKTPKDILEKIIKDADLDYLGDNNFIENANNLKSEVEAIKKIKIMDPDWQHGSIKFLREHKYYTNTQKKERLKQKKENEKTLEQMLKELEKEGI